MYTCVVWLADEKKMFTRLLEPNEQDMLIIRFDMAYMYFFSFLLVEFLVVATDGIGETGGSVALKKNNKEGPLKLSFSSVCAKNNYMRFSLGCS